MTAVAPLIGVSIAERASKDAPSVLRRAMAFAGRLACDAGAAVYSDANMLAAEPDAVRLFLEQGKVFEGPPKDAFYLATPGARTAADGAGVTLRAFPKGLAHPPASDFTLQAEAGICALIGDPARPPLKLGGAQTAFATGYAAYAALCALILKQRRFALVDHAEVDALSALSWVNWKAVAAASLGQHIEREGQGAEWPVLPCADGHVALVYTERDWPSIVEMVGDARLADPALATFAGRAARREEVQAVFCAWLAPRTKAEIEAALAKFGLPDGVVATPADLLADPLIAHRSGLKRYGEIQGKAAQGPCTPVRYAFVAPSGARGGAERGAARVDSALPLAGVRVLDLGIITAGAGVSAILADLGADVVKIESETYPDPFRMWAGSNDSPLFKFNNRNKRAAAIDLKTSEGRARFLDMAAHADIVVENFRRGVMDRLGLGFDALRTANPRIVLLSVTAQGLDGPGAEGASFGSSIEARSGIAALSGYAGEMPYVSGRNLNYPDQIACLCGAAAALEALNLQIKEDYAIHLDVSQRDLAVFTLGPEIISASLSPQRAGGPRGNAEEGFAFQDAVRCADGAWIAVSLTPELAQVAARAFNLARIEHLHTWCAARAADAVISELRVLGAPVARARKGSEILADPRTFAANAFAYAPSGDLVKGFAFQFEIAPMRITRNSPRIGEHTEEVIAHVEA
ncbi:MAG: CoA transferase [Hyphomonadaceae bacterium]